MRYLLLVDTCLFCPVSSCWGAACTINTFHACVLRSVQSKVFSTVLLERGWMDWIDIYIESAGSFLQWLSTTTSYSVEYIQTQKSLKFTYHYYFDFSSHLSSESITSHFLTTITIFSPYLYPSILSPSTIDINQVPQHSQTKSSSKKEQQQPIRHNQSQKQKPSRIIIIIIVVVHFPALAHDHDICQSPIAIYNDNNNNNQKPPSPPPHPNLVRPLSPRRSRHSPRPIPPLLL